MTHEKIISFRLPLLIALGILTGIYFLFLVLELRIPVAASLLDTALNFLLIGGMGISLLFYSRYFHISLLDKKHFIISYVVSGMFLSLLFEIIYYLIISSMMRDQQYPLLSFRSLLWRYTLVTIIYFLMVGFLTIMYLKERITKSAEEEAELRLVLRETELKSLRYQINPHFLFNSLNSIASLMNINTGEAHRMLMKVSDFFRYTLSQSVQPLTELKDEVQLLRSYLEIEQIRFSDRLNISIELAENTESVKIPSLLLQPLIENSVKYGLYDKLGEVQIKLTAQISDRFAVITISNEHDGDTKHHNSGTGTGLENIRNRLTKMFHRADLLQIKKDDHIFTVQVFIPLEVELK